MNAYLVADGDGVYVIVAARNRREALRLYPDAGAAHCRLLERDVEAACGDITFVYERTRGVDLILSGVILPNWFIGLNEPVFNDYRDWAGFNHMDEGIYPELVE